MLGQATAVLVSLSTLLTSEVAGMGLLAITFHQLLTLTRPSYTGLVEASVLLVIHFIVLIIFDRTVIPFRFTACH